MLGPLGTRLGAGRLLRACTGRCVPREWAKPLLFVGAGRESIRARGVGWQGCEFLASGSGGSETAVDDLGRTPCTNPACAPPDEEGGAQ
jgi:hypothetical protein